LIREGDAESWFKAWWGLAERVDGQAREALAAGHAISARQGLLKASNYYRSAYVFMMQPNPDARLFEAYRAQRRAFEKALETTPGVGSPVSIPYEAGHLQGYLFRCPLPGPRPVLVITGGYDSTCEEAFLYSGPAALARGYHVLTYDGPGQGAALIEQGLIFRPDWENVLGPVIEWLRYQPDIDRNRIAQLGISFGGYLAPRAASGLSTLAATIADPGQLSLLEEFRARMPAFLARAVPNGNPVLSLLLRSILNGRLRHLTKGWALRRGLWVHGVKTPLDYVRLTQRYATDAAAITCPMLICSAEDDEIGATADRLFDAIQAPKTRLRFLASEGAAGHCETLGRSVFNMRMFDWLDRTLSLS
jgi:alpha-beta hydrolase superfamily lysophospholipase